MAVADGYRSVCPNISDIMESIWQNLDYVNYVENVTMFNPAQCSFDMGKCMILQKVGNEAKWSFDK